MKKVLAINFSQTGQLDQIIDNFLTPFNNVDVEIDRVKIEPKDPYPFPWKGMEFYNVMPETVLEKPIELISPQYKFQNYDLIVLGYQPWYLSPSLPTTALFENKYFCALLKDKPIVTIIGSRNMWLKAQERVKSFINKAGGNLVANIPLSDKAPNLISAITILHWMTTGKKEKKWGFFPIPGVSQKDINETHQFGEKVVNAISMNSYSDLQDKILSLNKFKINTNILFIELRAKKLFEIWAKTIVNNGTTTKKRSVWLKIFKNYLFIALFFVAPIVLTVYNIAIRPLTFNMIKRKKEYFRSIKLN
jgi:hypothetical protein